jgi:hypothetical protein
VLVLTVLIGNEKKFVVYYLVEFETNMKVTIFGTWGTYAKHGKNDKW